MGVRVNQRVSLTFYSRLISGQPGWVYTSPRSCAVFRLPYHVEYHLAADAMILKRKTCKEQIRISVLGKIKTVKLTPGRDAGLLLQISHLARRIERRHL